MPGSITHSENSQSEGDLGRRGNEGPSLAEEEIDLESFPESAETAELLRFTKALFARSQAEQLRIQELSEQLSLATAVTSSHADRPAAIPLGTVSIEEANAVVHSRDQAAMQEISARENELARTRAYAQAEHQRMEAEGMAAIQQLRAQAEEARRQSEEAKLQSEAAHTSLRAGEAAAQAILDRERNQSHLMQRALQEQQGLVSNELGRATAEQQAAHAELDRLRMEVQTLRSQVPGTGVRAAPTNPGRFQSLRRPDFERLGPDPEPDESEGSPSLGAQANQV